MDISRQLSVDLDRPRNATHTPSRQTRQTSTSIAMSASVCLSDRERISRTTLAYTSLLLTRKARRFIVMSTSVCVSVCLSVCPQAYLRNYTSNLHCHITGPSDERVDATPNATSPNSTAELNRCSVLPKPIPIPRFRGIRLGGPPSANCWYAGL